MQISPENGLKAWELWRSGVPMRDVASQLGLSIACVRQGIKEIVDTARADLETEAKATFTKVDEILSDLLGKMYEQAKLGDKKATHLCLGLSKQLMDLYKLSPDQNIRNQTLLVLGNKSDTEILAEANMIGFKQIQNFLAPHGKEVLQLTDGSPLPQESLSISNA